MSSKVGSAVSIMSFDLCHEYNLICSNKGCSTRTRKTVLEPLELIEEGKKVKWNGRKEDNMQGK